MVKSGRVLCSTPATLIHTASGKTSIHLICEVGTVWLGPSSVTFQGGYPIQSASPQESGAINLVLEDGDSLYGIVDLVANAKYIDFIATT